MPSTWIVVRIDGCHFHRFSEIHEFVKPNDDRALNLTNSCAVAILEKFWEGIVFAYGSVMSIALFLRKALVASGKSKREAQNSLKGAQLQKKIEELAIDYNKLPIMYRQGSSFYRDKVDYVLIHQENEESAECYGKVIVEYIDIIGPTYWLEHPNILDE
ncbi:hypothetical protein Fmac_028148 [Flemingia macrophylla]|uniref:tRNA(His) guanylyltransferase n=1 Tax=Flemingia macrophylla TaxID=520843 RepID=A0ABD1LJU0_9FABA